MTSYLRESPEQFAALRDETAERLGVAPQAIEKDYWATEVLRAACDSRSTGVVFKGGTSLSKAFRLIERFSEDVDLLIVTTDGGVVLPQTLRAIADEVSVSLVLPHEREREGRGFLNARFSYPTYQPATFLTSGVLLEMGSRGGPIPNEVCSVGSLMSETARTLDPSAEEDFADLSHFQVTVLAPERTVAEKLAFLHHRATTGDTAALQRGARHLYDVTLTLRAERVRQALVDNRMAELMADVDARSLAAGWPFTPRPERGFAQSALFTPTGAVREALEIGFRNLRELVWGELPTVDEALSEVASRSQYL